MVKVNSIISYLDSTLGDVNTLKIRVFKSIIDDYVKMKTRKFSNNDTRLNNEEEEIVTKAKDVIVDLVKKSIDYLYCNDYSQIFSKQSERCVCARLAFVLENALKLNNVTNYFVDVEYVLFKKKHSSKDKEKGTSEDNKKGYCDLLIHSRGKNTYANILLAIEMKVHKNSNMVSDIRRLKKLTSPWPIPYDNNRACDSLVGLFLIIQSTQYKYIKVHRREDRSKPTEENWITNNDVPKESYRKLKKELKK